MTADPLDRQREVLVGTLNDARPSPDWAWEVLNTWDLLVDVARAARAANAAGRPHEAEESIVIPEHLWRKQQAALARLEAK